MILVLLPYFYCGGQSLLPFLNSKLFLLTCAVLLMIVQMVIRVNYCSVCLRVKGVMEHPIGHFITPLCGDVKHPKGNFTITVVISPQKVFMKPLCFYSVPFVVHTNRDPK